MYLLGKTGTGKSTLLENLALHDIQKDEGVAFFDPHGESVEKLLDYIPSSRINDVVYINPHDTEYPLGFNVLELKDSAQKHLVASGLMAVFTKMWANVWSARMEYILNNTVLALLDTPGQTLMGIPRMYVDKKFRSKIVSNIKDPVVRNFWEGEYANYTEKLRTEAISPIQNKVGQFLSSSIIRNIVAQPKSTIDFREIMDERKILLVNLSKGRIGEDNSSLLGAMMITKLQLAAMSRVDMLQEERQDFYLYVDEFQNFATEAFATILSEARKYKLNLIVAHQYIAQLFDPSTRSSPVRDAVFGNVGTMIIFRIGADDAEFLEREFEPVFEATDLVNLSKYSIYLKLMINGVASAPFSAQTLAPIASNTENKDKVISVSRERHATRRDIIERKIAKCLSVEYFADVGKGAQMEGEEEEEEEEAEIKNEEQRKKEMETKQPEIKEPPVQSAGRTEKRVEKGETKIPQKQISTIESADSDHGEKVWEKINQIHEERQESPDELLARLLGTIEEVKLTSDDKPKPEQKAPEPTESKLKPGQRVKF